MVAFAGILFRVSDPRLLVAGVGEALPPGQPPRPRPGVGFRSYMVEFSLVRFSAILVGAASTHEALLDQGIIGVHCLSSYR